MPNLLIALLVTSALASPTRSSQTPATVVFVDVAALPMDKDQVLSHRDVLVQGGTIRSLDQHRPNRQWPPDAIVVRGEGKYLIPALSDMHIHTHFGDEQQLKLYIVNGEAALHNCLAGKQRLLQVKCSARRSTPPVRFLMAIRRPMRHMWS